MDSQTKRIFDDEQLFKWLWESNIPFALDEQGLVAILPDEKGERPQLIVSHYYTDLELHKLKESGDISARYVTSGQLPALQIVHGFLNIDKATEADLSALQVVKTTLKVNHLQELVSPVEYVGDAIYARHVRKADLRKLEHVGDSLHFSQGEEACLDALKYVGRQFHWPYLKKLHAPVFETVVDAMAIDMMEDIYAPKLKNIGRLYASDMAKDYLKHLFVAENKEDIEKPVAKPKPILELSQDDMYKILESLVDRPTTPQP